MFARAIFVSKIFLWNRILKEKYISLNDILRNLDFELEIVILTALGVGGSTIFGSLLGLIFRRTSRTFNDISMSFAAGIMLAAAIFGLIIPSLDYGGRFGFLFTVLGIFVGAFCLVVFDILVAKSYSKWRINGEVVDEKLSA